MNGEKTYQGDMPSMNKMSDPGSVSNAACANESQACSPYPANQNLIGECRAVFTAHAHPYYSHIKDDTYILKVWQVGESVYCVSRHIDARPYENSPLFTYQSMAEFLKNWTRVSWISPMDKIKEQVQRMEKAQYACQDELRTLMNMVFELKIS